MKTFLASTLLAAVTVACLHGETFPRQLEESLQRAGENRDELKKALAEPAPAAEDVSYLVNRASQSDLANLTAAQLKNTVDLSRKAMGMPWYQGPGGVTPDMWREYVLPYRVLDEPLDDWRPGFYEALASQVEGCQTSGEAAVIAHKWIWSAVEENHKPRPRVQFDNNAGEYRNMSPGQLIKLHSGSCFDINILQVAVMRAIGVPARFCCVPYWTDADECYHSWIEYWDTKSSRWVPLDAVSDARVLLVAMRRFAVAYALPGYSSEPDLIGKERWDLMENTTEKYCSMNPKVKFARLKVRLEAETSQAAVPITVYTYNYGAWRAVAMSSTTNMEAEFPLCATDGMYPYLVSASVNGQLFWSLCPVLSHTKNEIVLQKDTPNKDVACPPFAPQPATTGG